MRCANASEIDRTFASCAPILARLISWSTMPALRRGAFESITDEEWQYDFDLKLMAAVRLSRLVLPSMKANRWGRILNLLNTYAKTPEAGTAPTSVTRAAGMALTKVLASEGAPHNVLVNALNIGRIESDQIRRQHERSGSNLSLEAFIEKAGRRPADGPVWLCRRMRKPCLPPLLRCRWLRERHRHQCRR